MINNYTKKIFFIGTGRTGDAPSGYPTRSKAPTAAMK